ncbi:MAG: hypothetical protein KDK61_05555, partial [Simkania sp.]|nr:hypothetical protein [Simkania sp.]
MSANKLNNSILYGINDFPPIHKTAVLSLQHVLTMFGSTVAVPLLLGPLMNMNPDQIGTLISSVMLCSGIVTILQVVIGSGLPIIQGVSFSFLAAFMQIISEVNKGEGTVGEALKSLGTNPQHLAMQYIAGAIICGSVIEMAIGWGKLIGKLRRILTPVVVGPVIMMIGLALYPAGVAVAASDFKISILTIAAILIFSQILSKKSLIFQMFPILLAIILSYSVCYLFTYTGHFTLGYSVIDTETLMDDPNTEEVEKGGPSLYGKVVELQALPAGYVVVEGIPENLQDKLTNALKLAGESPSWLMKKETLEEFLKVHAEEDMSGVSQNDADMERFKVVNNSFLSGPQQAKALKISDKHPAAIDYSVLKLTPRYRNYKELLLPWGAPVLPLGNVKDPKTGESSFGINPYFKWAFFFAILAAFLASIIESFGDFHSASLMAGGGMPTAQQINRGIGTEGFGCCLTGLLGGFSSTSYSENIGL